MKNRPRATTEEMRLMRKVMARTRPSWPMSRNSQ
jgi:hypothetical protein